MTFEQHVAPFNLSSISYYYCNKKRLQNSMQKIIANNTGMNCFLCVFGHDILKVQRLLVIIWYFYTPKIFMSTILDVSLRDFRWCPPARFAYLVNENEQFKVLIFFIWELLCCCERGEILFLLCFSFGQLFYVKLQSYKIIPLRLHTLSLCKICV